MSISSSLSAGVVGLASNATRLATIADNIANSQTPGYKRVEANFHSMVVTSGGGAYTAGGVRTTTHRHIDQNSAITTTSNATDLAVSGRGFLPVWMWDEDIDARLSQDAQARLQFPKESSPTGSDQKRTLLMEGLSVPKQALQLATSVARLIEVTAEPAQLDTESMSFLHERDAFGGLLSSETNGRSGEEADVDDAVSVADAMRMLDNSQRVRRDLTNTFAD